MKSFKERLDRAKNIGEIFEVVKDAVHRTHKSSRAGLSLGLAEMGGTEGGFVGAFYPFGSNIIVLNKTPIKKIFQSEPELYKPYTFHVLLHEYLHSLGYVNERFVHEKVYEISRNLFGPKHLATKIAKDITKFLPYLTYPPEGWKPENIAVELVRDFDTSNTEYIG